jgi:hypothetical protein
MIGMAAPMGQRLRCTIAASAFFVIPGQRIALEPELMEHGQLQTCRRCARGSGAARRPPRNDSEIKNSAAF